MTFPASATKSTSQCQHFAISRKSAESSRSTRTSSCVKMLSFFTALPHSPNALCSVRSSRFPASVQKIALALLSGITVDQLKDAVDRGETGLLTKVPGIGKKTAERLVLELKGKLAGTGAATAAAAVPTSGARADVAAALIALGYSEREARRDEEAPRGLHGERRPASGTQVTHALSLTGVSAPRRCAMLILTTAFSFSPRCPKTPPTA